MNPGKGVWKAAGWILTAIGIAGYFLPVLPGTVFLILALFCFQRGGNTKMHAWLLSNRYFGPTLRDWDENKWVTKKVKVMAISVMWAFGLGSCFFNPKPMIIAAVVALCAGGTWYIASRPTKPVRLRLVEGEAEKTTRRAAGQ